MALGLLVGAGGDDRPDGVSRFVAFGATSCALIIRHDGGVRARLSVRPTVCLSLSAFHFPQPLITNKTRHVCLTKVAYIGICYLLHTYSIHVYYSNSLQYFAGGRLLAHYCKFKLNPFTFHLTGPIYSLDLRTISIQ